MDVYQESLEGKEEEPEGPNIYDRNSKVIYSNVNISNDLIKKQTNEPNATTHYNNHPNKRNARTLDQQLNKDNPNVNRFMDIHNCLKENFFNFETENKKILTKKSHNHFNIPFEKKFVINKRTDKNVFTIRDVIYYNNREVKMTNSIVFYLNHYYKKEPYIRFNTKIRKNDAITVIILNNSF